jgi:hypothetical protein
MLLLFFLVFKYIFLIRKKGALGGLAKGRHYQADKGAK